MQMMGYPKPYDIMLTDLAFTSEEDPSGIESWEYRIRARVPIIRMKLRKLSYDGVAPKVAHQYLKTLSDTEFVEGFRPSNKQRDLSLNSSSINNVHHDHDQSAPQPQSIGENPPLKDMIIKIDSLIDVDVGDNYDAVTNSRLLYIYSTWNPIVPFSVRILRALFQRWNIVKTNSYTICLLAIFALQHHQPPLIPNLHCKELLERKCSTDDKDIDNNDIENRPIQSDDIDALRTTFWNPKTGEWTNEERNSIGDLFNVPSVVMDWARCEKEWNNHVEDGVWHIERTWSKQPEFIRAVARYLLSFYINIFPMRNAVVDIRAPGHTVKKSYPFWLQKDVCIDHTKDHHTGCKFCLKWPYLTKGRNFTLKGNYGLTVLDPIERGRVIGIRNAACDYMTGRMYEDLKSLNNLKPSTTE